MFVAFRIPQLSSGGVMYSFVDLCNNVELLLN
jgi:hypothetical protein